MLDNFVKYDESFYGKSCILMLFLNDINKLNNLFANNYNKINIIISMIKQQQNLLWIGRTDNSKFRIDDFYASNKRENSLQESIAQLIAGKYIIYQKEEYIKLREIIAEWLYDNTVFYVRLCSDFEEEEPEIIKKNLIQKYKLPFNRKYNKTNFNKILYAE